MPLSALPPQFAVPFSIRGEIGRPSLVYRLSTAQGLPAVVVLAPSGYGKTTLVAQWLRLQGKPAIWLHLTPDTSEIEALVGCLTEAIRSFAPEVTLGLTPAQFLEGLLDLASPLQIVLDDVHLSSSETQKWLYQVIVGLPERFQFILLGYHLSALSVSKLLARGQAEVLGVTELSFSLSETENLCETRGVPNLAPRLWTQLEGWPLGVSLSSLRRSHDFTPEHLINDMLGELPAGYAHTLEAISTHAEWSPSLAPDLPPNWLDVVRRSGLPVTPVNWNSYRPHTSLLSVLAERLKLDPGRHEAVHLEAAERALQHDQWHSAIEHYLAAGLKDKALEAASPLVVYYWNRDIYEPIVKALELFEFKDLSLVRKNDLAALWGVLGDRERSVSAFSEMYRVGDFDSETLLSLADLIGLTDPPLATQIYREAISLNTDAQLHVGLLSSIGGLQLQTGQAQDALNTCEEGYTYCAAHPETGPIAKLQLHGCVSKALTSLGRFEAALECAERIMETAKSLARPKWYLRGLDAALRAVNERGNLSQPSPFSLLADQLNAEESVMFYWASVKLANVQHYLQLGDLPGARSRLSALGHSFLPPGSLTGGLRALVLADCQWQEGQTKQAEQTLLEAPTLPDRAYLNYLNFLRGQVALARDLTEAEHHFALVTDDAHWLRRRIAALLSPVSSSLEDPSAAHIPAYPGLTLQTLGDLRVTFGGRVVPIPLARARELLVFLALHGPVQREKVLDALWNGEGDPRHASHLKVLIRRLRLALGEVMPGEAKANAIVSAEGKLDLSPELVHRADVLLVRQIAQKPDAPVSELLEALELYKGEFLPDIDSEWVVLEREALTRLLGTLALRLHRHPRASAEQQITALRYWVTFEPFNEEAQWDLVRLLYHTGDESGSRLVYREFEQLLERELGESPPRTWRELIGTGS